MSHVSVLLRPSIDALTLHKGMIVVDGTFGFGGHSRSIAKEIGKDGQLVSFDADASVFTDELVSELSALTKFTQVPKNFRHISDELTCLGIAEIGGALFDLGLSSTQLEASGRGFSFQKDEPLLMTFKTHPDEQDVTAKVIVNAWSAESIATILRGFGDERYAWRIAQGIVEARKTSEIASTLRLVEIVKAATPVGYHHGKTHFATRTFQALRMAVNDELGAIEQGIEGSFKKLAPGGRIAVISFHSIEDRLVKQLFKKKVEAGIALAIFKKPHIPDDDELKQNPRARSAKLRVIEKM